MMSSAGLRVTCSIADRWRELSGHENNWKGLLDPPDIDLRRFIINYGDRAAAIRDAFNKDAEKDNCRGFSRYSPKEFFTKLGITNRNPYKYRVTDFVYSRNEIKFFDWVVVGQSSWCAYVAVATDEGKALLGRRDIVISWRGTSLPLEWFEDFEALPVSAEAIFGKDSGYDPKVHHGFQSIYLSKEENSIYNKMSSREQVLAAVRRLVDQYRDEEVSITVTGHSLGSAMATLNAVDIAFQGYNKATAAGGTSKSFPVTAFVTGCPKVGDEDFQKLAEGIEDLRVLRIKNANDPVPELPPIGYYHVGQELQIDAKQSPYLKTDSDHYKPHNLDAHLHGVAGSQGSKGGFKLEVDLDIALLNKFDDLLLDKYNVPALWWAQENKGMALQDDGSYKLEFYASGPPRDV